MRTIVERTSNAVTQLGVARRISTPSSLVLVVSPSNVARHFRLPRREVAPTSHEEAGALFIPGRQNFPSAHQSVMTGKPIMIVR